MEKLGWRDQRISTDSGSLFQTILRGAPCPPGMRRPHDYELKHVVGIAPTAYQYQDTWAVLISRKGEAWLKPACNAHLQQVKHGSPAIAQLYLASAPSVSPDLRSTTVRTTLKPSSAKTTKLQQKPYSHCQRKLLNVAKTCIRK
ncbi:hypothetical protein [Pseudomonas sp. 8Z]|uniref:hypothetical protein n=1 Tax=Pseudomonas sp. 8Z TaxID=2653166 RepID=UPI00135807F8|nr:hypothetical protein [Pseudomonas sp. 8Z]